MYRVLVNGIEVFADADPILAALEFDNRCGRLEKGEVKLMYNHMEIESCWRP